MRPLCLLLLLVAPLMAQEDLTPALETFRKACGEFEARGERSGVESALQVLEQSGDPAALEPIAAALVRTIGMELRLLQSGRKLQRKGADAFDRVLGLRGEIELLEQRKEAGATDLDPEIEKRRIEMRRLEATSMKATAERGRLRLLGVEVAAVRDGLADAYGRMLAAVGETAAGSAGIETLRKQLDLARPEHALYFVRILRGSGLRSAVPALIEVLDGPETSEALARGVISALGQLGTRAGVDALIRSWERNPKELGAPARHALSMAARQNLPDLEQARAWAKTLKD